jgi:hypothetical protein
MNTSVPTKRLSKVLLRSTGRTVGVFYLLTFLTGGIILFARSELGFIIELTAAVFYIAVTIAFYSLTKST